MMNKNRFFLAACLLLCLLAVCAHASAEAEPGHRVVVDGVTYRVGGPEFYDHVIVAFPQDAESITIHDTIEGFRIYSVYLDDYETPILAKQLVLGEGSTEFPSLYSGMFTQVERIVLPSTANSFRFDHLPLKEFVVHSDNPNFKTIDGVLFSRDGKSLLAFPEVGREHYQIPAGVTSIDYAAFYGNKTLKSVVLPEGFIFANSGFAYAEALESITLPSTVREIEFGFFPYDGQLKEIIISPDNPTLMSRDGVIYSKSGDTLVFCPNGRATLDIPPGTHALAEYALGGGLQSVTFPRGFEVIPKQAFGGHTSLEHVSFPIGLARIEKHAFAECIALSRVVLPPGLTAIEMFAFSGCEALREAHIPDSVTHIDPTAFDYTHPDFTIYANEGTEGHRYALSHGTMWAKPGGEPVRLARTRGEAAIVSLSHAEDMLPLLDAGKEGAKPLSEHQNGTAVEVLREEGDYAYVRVGLAEGYMHAGSLMRTDALTSLVKLVTLMPTVQNQDGWYELYTYPSLDAPVAAPYDIYDAKIIDQFGNWYYVDAREMKGYLPAGHAKVSREKDGDTRRLGVVVNPGLNDRLHLRASASKDAQSLGRYFSGTHVEILSEQGDWFEVRLGDGKQGFMMKAYVQEPEPYVPWWEQYEDSDGSPNG